jgi:hypothetical protein
VRTPIRWLTKASPLKHKPSVKILSMSKFSIAGFKDEESAFDFIRRIGDATVASLLSLSSAREKMPAVSIVQVRRIGKGNRSLYSEHHQYSSLFYLNDAAMAMCEDLGLPVSIVGEAEAMSEESSYDLEAYYVPLAQREKTE